MDPDRFYYSPIIDRPAIKWPGGARVALWVSPNVEHHEYTPPSRPTTPDVINYARADYGNRQGFWRMLEVLDKHNVRCCISLNVAVLEHFPEIRDAMVERDYDYMSHGIYNTRPISDYSEAEEREFYRDTIETVKKHTGKQLKGMLGPAVRTTVNTADLMAEAGLIYHTDWFHDDQPFPIKVKKGKLISLPYSIEVNDSIISMASQDAEYFCQVIKDQFDVLYEEGAESGRVMCIALHPHWIGNPNRAKYLDEALGYILAHDGVWQTTADDIADYYIANHYDEVLAYVEEQKRKGIT